MRCDFIPPSLCVCCVLNQNFSSPGNEFLFVYPNSSLSFSLCHEFCLMSPAVSSLSGDPNLPSLFRLQGLTQGKSPHLTIFGVHYLKALEQLGRGACWVGVLVPQPHSQNQWQLRDPQNSQGTRILPIISDSHTEAPGHVKPHPLIFGLQREVQNPQCDPSQKLAALSAATRGTPPPMQRAFVLPDQASDAQAPPSCPHAFSSAFQHSRKTAALLKGRNGGK